LKRKEEGGGKGGGRGDRNDKNARAWEPEFSTSGRGGREEERRDTVNGQIHSLPRKKRAREDKKELSIAPKRGKKEQRFISARYGLPMRKEKKKKGEKGKSPRKFFFAKEKKKGSVLSATPPPALTNIPSIEKREGRRKTEKSDRANLLLYSEGEKKVAREESNCG